MKTLPKYKYIIVFWVGLTFFLYQVAMAYCSLHDPSTHIDAGDIVFIHTDAQKSSLTFFPQTKDQVSPPEYIGKAMVPGKTEPSHARIIPRGLLASRAPPQ